MNAEARMMIKITPQVAKVLRAAGVPATPKHMLVDKAALEAYIKTTVRKQLEQIFVELGNRSAARLRKLRKRLAKYMARRGLPLRCQQ
jgi:hypothetical protein